MLAEWIVAGTAIVGVAFEGLRRGRKFDKSFQSFLSDWHGQPERPGVPARPGVMERLELIELSQVDNRAEVGKINKRLERKGI